MSRCNCEYCKLYIEVKKHTANSSKEVSEFITELHNMYTHTSEELCWANSVINGNWPESDEIIKNQRKEFTIKNNEPVE